MKQNHKKTKALLYTASLCFILFSFAITVYGKTVETVVPAETEPDEEKSLAIKEVYEIFNSPSGKDYLNEAYFDGSEMQIYEEQDYYLIGMQGAKFYSYLLYDKEKKTISDLGMQNEVIQWYEEKNIYTTNDSITFYCTGQKKQEKAPRDFPYCLYYDMSEKRFSKTKEELIYGTSIDQKWNKSYRIGSECSQSNWLIKKLEKKTDGFSIYFDKADITPIAEYDYPEMRVETELNGEVRLWIKNCAAPPKEINNFNMPEIGFFQMQQYDEGNERGLLVSFQVMPDLFLYGEIEQGGYHEPLTFTIERAYWVH